MSRNNNFDEVKICTIHFFIIKTETSLLIGGQWGGMSFTSYKDDSSAGGVTTRIGNFVSRFNKTGQCIGTGIRMPNVGTTFFSKDGMPTDRLTPFK